jgi:[protein-PII] uridylyltransferase
MAASGAAAKASAEKGAAPRQDATLIQWRKWLAERRAELRESYLASPEPRPFLRAHAKLVDTVLTHLWHDKGMPDSWALIAVGGYGRGGLFPHSDVDVLVLTPEDAATAAAEPFVGALWDCGIEPGHSVRSIAQCVEEAELDVTVLTSLLETRLITGDAKLFAAMKKAVRTAVKPREFFNAKLEEQRIRHARALDAAFRLEPNLKENPGGLRDLQTIIWVADAAGMGRIPARAGQPLSERASWLGLAEEGLITRGEALTISKDERALQDLRIRLPRVAKTGWCSITRTGWPSKWGSPPRQTSVPRKS